MSIQTKELVEAIQPMIEQGISRSLEKLFGDKAADNRNLIYGLNGLAEFLGVTKSTAIRAARTGKFPYYRIGQTRIFKADEILAAIRVEPGENAKFGYKESKTKSPL